MWDSPGTRIISRIAHCRRSEHRAGAGLDRPVRRFKTGADEQSHSVVEPSVDGGMRHWVFGSARRRFVRFVVGCGHRRNTEECRLPGHSRVFRVFHGH